jgi:mannose-6-phosphate isomerase-like protein (cupin superfamily)
MRRTEVNARRVHGDLRLYYCDRNVDIVMTTVTKPMQSEWHRHRRNIEFYFVLMGKLTIDTDDHVEHLREGDMIQVPPLTWHRFRTTSKVTFFAMKKIPLLNDKETRPLEGQASNLRRKKGMTSR